MSGQPADSSTDLNAEQVNTTTSTLTSTDARKRSRGIIIAVSVGVVVLIILVLMFVLGGGFNITASEVALGLAAVAITGVAAYVIGKKVGQRLEDSVKHHATKHKFL